MLDAQADQQRLHVFLRLEALLVELQDLSLKAKIEQLRSDLLDHSLVGAASEDSPGIAQRRPGVGCRRLGRALDSWTQRDLCAPGCRTLENGFLQRPQVSTEVLR